MIEQNDGDVLLMLLQEKAACGGAYNKWDLLGLILSPLLHYSQPLDEALPDAARVARVLPEEERKRVVGAMIGFASRCVDWPVIASIMESADLPDLLQQYAERRFAQDFVEGKAMGQRNAIRVLLRSRFGAVSETVEQRISSAEADELDALIVRIASVGSLGEL